MAKQIGKVLKAATEHAAANKKRRIEIPEWTVQGKDGKPEPVVIYADPMPLSLMNKINVLANNDMAAVWAYTLIYCAMDEDGEPVFDHDHLPVLMDEVDGDVVTRVAQLIRNSELLKSLEERVKNFGTIQDE